MQDAVHDPALPKCSCNNFEICQLDHSDDPTTYSPSPKEHDIPISNAVSIIKSWLDNYPEKFPEEKYVDALAILTDLSYETIKNLLDHGKYEGINSDRNGDMKWQKSPETWPKK